MATDDIGLKFGPALDVEHADALGGVQLVSAERQEINAQLTDIEFEFARHLNGVCVAKHSLAAAQSGDFFDGEQHASLVVGHHR